MAQALQIKIAATYMRGGTSKGVFFRLQDLPERAQKPGPARDALLLRVIGSPDPYAKQIDGMGGATSSTSKTVILSTSSKPNHDVDYLFGQVGIDNAFVDWSGNCGNLSAAVGPFAISNGLIDKSRVPQNGIAIVRIWQGNIGKTIIAHVPMTNGAVQETGDFELDGVTFPAAEVQLEFMDPAAEEAPSSGPADHLSNAAPCPTPAIAVPAIALARRDDTLSVIAETPSLSPQPGEGNSMQPAAATDNRGAGGSMFPTGNLVDDLEVPGVGTFKATMINAGIPTIFVNADALGYKGTELQDAINGDAKALAMFETIRAYGAVRMGLIKHIDEAAKRQHTPKIAFVAPSKEYVSSSGKKVNSADADLLVRALSMGKLHHAMMGTAAVAIGTAAAIPGTLVSLAAGGRAHKAVRFGHPSGTLRVGAEATQVNGEWIVTKAIMSRSARVLMEGFVRVPGDSF